MIGHEVRVTEEGVYKMFSYRLRCLQSTKIKQWDLSTWRLTVQQNRWNIHRTGRKQIFCSDSTVQIYDQRLRYSWKWKLASTSDVEQQCILYTVTGMTHQLATASLYYTRTCPTYTNRGGHSSICRSEHHRRRCYSHHRTASSNERRPHITPSHDFTASSSKTPSVTCATRERSQHRSYDKRSDDWRFTRQSEPTISVQIKSTTGEVQRSTRTDGPINRPKADANQNNDHVMTSSFDLFNNYVYNN